jgi:dsDNA-specific endonuclease/ATPase MutS2
VKDYIGECIGRGILKVRIIHGKGKGQLRATVHSVLEKDPRVKSFGDAAPGQGGWGATWAVLE